MSKVNTLFSYFTKKPSTKNDSSGQSDVLSPARNGNSGGSSGALTQNVASPKQNGSSTPLQKQKLDCAFSVGDVVWTKLEGYPWWPGLVCNHPKDATHVKGGKRKEIHVQFFEDPPSRGWVKEKLTQVFTGSDSKDFQRGGKFFTGDPKCREAVKAADDALKLSLSERLDLVVAMESSPEEEEDEEEDMEEDVKDDDSDAGLDSSKENTRTPVKKTPSKLTRSSARPKAKRRRIMIASDSDEESEDEFKPVVAEESSDEGSSGVDEASISDSESVSEAEPSPVKEIAPSKKRKRPPPAPKTPTGGGEGGASPFTPSVGNKTMSRLASFSAPDLGADGDASESRNFTHLGHDFLLPDKIRDKQKRLKNDPDYDCRTVYLPESFLAKLTPAMRQWWDMKSRHFDTILFFKMGKFYELFHMDAVVAVNELGLIYMKGDYAHSGFPEIAYGRYAESLIQKGYKVARIEQTETPDMMAERIKKIGRVSTKFDRVVNREICSIQTKGTKRYSFIDGDSTDSANSYLLALCEKVDVDSGSRTMYGVCFVDTSIGKVHLGQFEDDRHCSRLRTLVSHFPPGQVLCERGKLSEKTQGLLSNNLPSVLKEQLKSGSEFWDSSKTLKFLSEASYFVNEANQDEGLVWPDVLKETISKNDALGVTAAEGCELAVSALGAVVWYLKACFMDHEVLSMRTFEGYVPLDLDPSQGGDSPTGTTGSGGPPGFLTGRQKMVLDSVTLTNLDILVNSSSGTTEGTLLERLNHCATPFGKRLFKQWLCAPLCNPDAIRDRQDAVDDLMALPEAAAEATELLKKLPDLERLLSKIHTLGSAQRNADHPDSRAIFFEDVTYSKRKIEDFLAALSGFRVAVEVMGTLGSSASDFKSKLLRQTVTVAKDNEAEAEGRFPDLTAELEFFDKAFDHTKARSEGVIKPSKGVDEDYDAAERDMKTIIIELNDYLDKQRKRLGCKNLVYWGTGKNRFQMEVPESAVRHVPNQYEVTSSKKGFKRYRTAEIENLLSRLIEAEELRDVALRDIMRRIFFSFDKSHRLWEAAVQCLSVLDVLMCLAQYSRCGDGVMCRPEFVTPAANQAPFLEVREGRHPCVYRTYSGGDFIPNDTVIGIQDEEDMDEGQSQGGHNSKVVLVTGPNMGGKSTLMRQVGTIVIMAQLGCHVPAETCRLTPVDRVFTRLGASDRIMSGESTFFVELSETSSILQHATPHSLVLLDELGRGTATYDGTAIACAVVRQLSQAIGCRTLFSTHYHSLVEEFSTDPNVRLGHMACMVENENEEDPSQETITFLYKFVKGACPKSYGFNAARLADIPDQVIGVAHRKAREFQATTDNIRIFKELVSFATVDLPKLLSLQAAIAVS